jgi:hypothetical protein
LPKHRFGNLVNSINPPLNALPNPIREGKGLIYQGRGGLIEFIKRQEMHDEKK